MAYQAIYRKWRPTVFEDVVGQTHITKTLQSQLESGRPGHAYLFCGTRGTGKTTCAKIFSKAVNCLSPKNGSPCNECAICRGISDGSIMDVFEIDAASNNGVDNIREIIEDAKYVATEAKYRVYIIDEVHMLSGGAFNALLKTLEEPPEHVIFILATTEAHKVPQTILSRCQRFDFKRIRPDDIIRRMREIAMGDGLSLTDEAYSLLAELADGSMRDGLSILERCVAQAGTTLTYDSITDALGISGKGPLFAVVDSINQGDGTGILETVNALMNDGKDLHVFIDSLIEHFRNIMVCKVTDNPENILSCDEEELIKFKAQAEKTTFDKLSHAVSKLSSARAEAKWVKEPRVIYELCLIKLAKPELESSYEAILDRLSKCEEKIKNGITVQVQNSEPEKKEEKKEPEKPKPSGRTFVPVDVSTLTSSSPTVSAARKWDKTVQTIVRQHPHLASAIMGRKVTIDGEGIILIFDKKELMMKKIAATYIKQIADAVSRSCGVQLIVKTAFLEDIEDNIIDYWAIGGGEKTVADASADPIDALTDSFPEIVEITDESEFLDYNAADDNFSQAEFSDRDDEEFLEDNEIEEE